MPGDGPPILSVRNLDVAFGPVRAVRGISFDVFPNEVVCIVGESGSGKSVAALAACGLLPPGARVRGHVTLGATVVTAAPPESLRRMRGQDVGFIFQDPATTLNPVLRIGHQVTEAPVAHGRLAPTAAPARAIELLREVEIADPAGRARQHPHQFSGGMRQRAVTAMAMAGRPRLIIADEPTTALDVTVQAQVLDLLRRRQAETGAAIVLITHDLGVVAEMADRVLVMYAGRIVETATVHALFATPQHPYTAALLRSMPRLDDQLDERPDKRPEKRDGARLRAIPGQPPSPIALPPGCAFLPRCPVARNRAICAEHDPAGPVACHFPGQPRGPDLARPDVRRTKSGAPLLEVEDLRVHFPMRRGAVRAVDGVSFTVHAGETLGLVGESGCGKTTTGRAVMGLVRATAGRIRFDGQDIAGLSRRALRPVRRHMQYVFQDPFAALNPALTVGEAIAEPLRIHGLYDELGGARHIASLLDRVGLPPAIATRPPREFSGGQKQRIGIARALALRPRLLILDEPVAALDVSIQAQIVNLLQDLQAEFGLAYLFIAHDLSVVRHISDRVAVMYLGRIVETGGRDGVYAHASHPYTQALLSSVPLPDPALRHRRARIVMQGEIADPSRPPPGCALHPRCGRATPSCAIDLPLLAAHAGLATACACHHPGPA